MNCATSKEFIEFKFKIKYVVIGSYAIILLIMPVPCEKIVALIGKKGRLNKLMKKNKLRWRRQIDTYPNTVKPYPRSTLCNLNPSFYILIVF